MPAAEMWAEPTAFAAWTNDDSIRLASSSGGMFSELARPVIEAGGAVVGCVWGANWTPEHVIARTWADAERMRGSKYVPSRVGEAYRDVLLALRERDMRVLFSGTPCQVAAMRNALNAKQRERVLLVEFFCHGVPSLRAFHGYLEELFGGEKVASYTFRDKTLGWQTVVAESVHGQRYRSEMATDVFGRGFVVENLFLMEACYECPFVRLPRAGDITLGDFWGCPEGWHDRKGVSVVLANSAAGLRALEAINASGGISLKPVELALAVAHNRCGDRGRYPAPRGRQPFLDGLARGESFARLAEKYFPGKWGSLWRGFRQSKSKARFVAEVLGQHSRRVFGSSR